jgi:hypothetical protein
MAIIASGWSYFSAGHSTAPVIVKKVALHAAYVADFRDDKILMGASHNVFIARVTREVGTKGHEFGPETQFEVEVIENIKGDLSGTVIVNQQGGYETASIERLKSLSASNDRVAALRAAYPNEILMKEESHV